jgi:hypothetical protein
MGIAVTLHWCFWWLLPWTWVGFFAGWMSARERPKQLKSWMSDCTGVDKEFFCLPAILVLPCPLIHLIVEIRSGLLLSSQQETSLASFCCPVCVYCRSVFVLSRRRVKITTTKQKGKKIFVARLSYSRLAYYYYASLGCWALSSLRIGAVATSTENPGWTTSIYMSVIFACAHKCIFGPCFIVMNGRWGMQHNFCMREDIRKHCPISYVRFPVPVRLIGINH